MRDIKFRAWDLDHKWMDTEFYVRADSGIAYDKPSRVYDTPNIEIEENPNLVIMQYTGLKDSNGVEIYEGDIVDFYGVNCEILWIESDASFFIESPDKSLCESGQEFGGNCEIIGNIYQNPELLK